MKHLVIVANGLTDQPIAERNNQTPLQLAQTPNLDRLAQQGRTGSVQTIPENLAPGCDVSYLALLGYDPETYHSGSAVFAAAALGVKINPGEVPLCCDFITLQSSHNDMVMKDYTAGRLPSEDSKLLLDALQENINGHVQFHAGEGHHNLMVLKSGPLPDLTSPRELIGEGIRQYLPTDQACKEIVFIMNQAQIILHNHPYNKKRVGNGTDAVNSVWFWGNGKEKPLPEFSKKFNKRASLVTASLLFKGMGLSAGLNTVAVEGATGFVDTNYSGKVKAALDELEKQDIVYLNIAAAEEASLQGNIDDKIQAIENFDSEALGPILKAADCNGDLKILVTGNHVSSVDLMRYKKDPVPFAVYPSDKGTGKIQSFDEEIVRSGDEHFKSGPELIEAFFGNKL